MLLDIKVQWNIEADGRHRALGAFFAAFLTQPKARKRVELQTYQH